MSTQQDEPATVWNGEEYVPATTEGAPRWMQCLQSMMQHFNFRATDPALEAAHSHEEEQS